LKQKYARLAERMEKGASGNFSDEEKVSSADEEETKESRRRRASSIDETERKRHKKTAADLEREQLERGDLYGVLGLERLTYEATDKQITKGY